MTHVRWTRIGRRPDGGRGLFTSPAGRAGARCAFAALGVVFLLMGSGEGVSAPAKDPQAYADALKSELSAYARSGSSRSLTAMLQLGQQFIKDPGALVPFRAAIDVEAASGIVSVAMSSDRALRIAAARLLVDLVDNRTMCAVADALMQDDLDADARYNFLQILRVANRYAMAENRAWNGRAIRSVRAFLPPKGSKANFSKTDDLVTMLEKEEASFASPANLLVLQETQPDSYRACRSLPHIAKLGVENGSDGVFLHTRRPPGEVAAVKAGLEALGFTVRGVDDQVDLVGGPGIDYSAGSSASADARRLAEAKADGIGAILGSVLNVTPPSRPQSQMQEGAFGLWF